MPPRMRTRSAGGPAAKSLGWGTCVRVGRGERGRRPREERVNGNVEGVNGGGGAPDFSTIIVQQLQNLLPAMLAQVGNQGNVGNQNGNVINENVQENVRNVIVNGNRVGAGHAAYTDRFHELARLVPHLVTLESRMIERYVYSLAPQIRGMVAATEPKTIQKSVQIFGALTDKAVKNGSIEKVEKRGNVGEPSNDKNGRDDNKRTRTENAFASIANLVGRDDAGDVPKCATCNSYHVPGVPCRTCFNCNHLGYLARDCRGVPRNVNPVNARNTTVRACYECGSIDHVRSACSRLKGHKDQKKFVETKLLLTTRVRVGETKEQHKGVGNSCWEQRKLAKIRTFELGFRYEIEIASGQLVKIDKVIKGCKLEIEGHVFDIDFHEKVSKGYPYNGKVLRVLGERPEEKARLLMSAKASDKKQEEIVVVRDFLKVFPDDLSGLPPLWEIEFRI
ncbi:putative reverse transcriptase domain-containing protein [Tanacetum coccineum]